MRTRPRIYLAGPMANCNPRQQHEWRDELVRRWGDEFDFVDPSRELHGALTPYAAARADRELIAECDAMLANLWRESVGTAIGVVTASQAARPVVVADPNRIDSRAIALYADAIVDNVYEGMKHLKALLRERGGLVTVIKHAGKPDEPFETRKIADALREACRAAGRDDALAPVRLLPAVMAQLATARGTARGKVTSTAIKDAVWEVLARYEADPAWSEAFSGIRAAWESYDARRRPGGRLAAPAAGDVPLHDAPLAVRTYAPKSHTTIWGVAVRSINDVPGEARRIFEEIARVEGIAEIVLRQFVGRRSRSREKTCVENHASKDVRTIEGKCYDNASGGKMQTFQVKVHDDAQREAVRVTLVRHLQSLGLLCGGGFRE